MKLKKVGFVAVVFLFLAFAPAGNGQEFSGGPPQGGRGRGMSPAQQGVDITASRNFDETVVKRGETEFGTLCASCHGTDARGGGKGQTGVDLIRSPIVLDDVEGREIGEFLKYGRPEKGMPKFDLTAAQVSDIANFLHYNITVISERGAYKYRDVLTGDPKAGEAYFNGAGECTKCHSATGDLKGIASKFSAPEIQSRIITGGGASGRGFGFGRGRGGPSATDRTAMITLASGKTVSGSLTFINDYVVTIQRASGAPESFFRNGDSPKIVIKNPLEAHVELGRKMSDKDMHNLTAYLETLK
ncbi:MAG TPA: c-type cytochrome [Tepidisphaeraceae bacterium]|nr:c-type cytochrome [Tepidisphaeraceae bacterium]